MIKIGRFSLAILPCGVLPVRFDGCTATAKALLNGKVHIMHQERKTNRDVASRRWEPTFCNVYSISACAR
jgi:hypothetical protein